MPAYTPDPATLAAALDSIPLGVLVADPEGIIVWGNPQLGALTGYSHEELAGKSIAFLDLGAITKPEPLPHRVVCRRKTGELFPAVRTVTPLPDGKTLVTLQELAAPSREAEKARRQMEERYKLISENAVDVIWLWTLKDRRTVFVSPSVERLRGFTAEEAVGQPMEEAMTPESCERSMKLMYKAVVALESGDESYRVRTTELEFLRKDGSTVATETVAKLLTNQEGKVEAILGLTRDITERKLAQDALQEAEEKYHQIFDGAMEGIYRTTVDGRPLAANPALAKMLGFDSVEEALATVNDVGEQLWVDAEERARFMKLMEERETVRNYECRQRRKDGAIIWVSVNSRRVRGPNGQLFNEGFMEDITERKRMEDALRESEHKFSTCFLSSPMGISIHDVKEDGRLLDVNEAFEETTGYQRGELLGRTVAELGLFADPALEPVVQSRLLADGRIRNLEFRLRTKSGEIRTALLSAEPIEIDGRLCSIGTTIDITERKQAEERVESLATAIEQAGEQVVITNLSGVIEYCNPAFVTATGYSIEEVLGQNPSVLKSGKQSEEFYRQLWKTISSGSVWTGQFTNRKKDGTLYQEDATISPIRDASGQIKGYVAVKRDVSERIQLENQFRQAQKLESVGRLAGGVAHDFNNLLTVINGYSGLLIDQLKTYDPLWPYASEIRKAGDRAAGLTRQLLAFSRKQVIEVRTLDLNLIVKDAERMLQRVIGEDIELVTTLDPQAGLVMGDLDQIHQVIMNLVVNARDAMPDGGKLAIETKDATAEEVSAAPQPDATPGRFVRLSVADNGVGMDEKTQESIFEPFFTTKEPGRGTGLGLSTVYGIVRQSGGWIEVLSREGQGTTFRIYLRRIDAGVLLPAAVPAPVRPASAGNTILLVEDHEEVRRLVSAVLARDGYLVLPAGDGAEAFMLAKDHPGEIHLLLTDVVMPGMNGKELSVRLRNLRPNIKVLFTSGYTADVIARRGVLDAHVAYLSKPFTADSLTAKVREVLQEPGTD